MPKKECPDNKIYNRISHRCVKKDGKIGKEILKKIAIAKEKKSPKSHKKVSPKKPSPKKNIKPKKECPDNKIYNRISHRCVKKDGKIGKEILKKIAIAKEKKSPPKKVTPKKASPKKVSLKKSPPKKVTPKKNISDFNNWEMPSLENLKLEFKLEHALKKHTFFKSEDDFLNAVKVASIKTITEQEDKNINYRTRTKTKQQLLNLIKKYASYPVYRNEKTLDEIYDGFKNNSPMKYPIVLELENGSKRVFSGNTRMDVAFQLGINPKVLIVKVGTKISVKKGTYSFIEGIHMLSLIKCAIKGEIDIDDINTWQVCNLDKSIYGKPYLLPPFNVKYGLDLSFLKPSEKLKDRMDVVEKVIQKSYKKFPSEFSMDFPLFLRTNQIRFNIYKYFDLLEGVSIERIQEVSHEKILSYAEPHMQNLKDLWKQIYENTSFYKNLYKLTEDIKYSKLMVKFGKDGCILKEDSNKIQKIEEGANLIRSIPYRMSEDFYVYRTSNPSSSYNTSEKILSVMKGELVENYPGMISTTWDLNFALGWDYSYCCLYVIKVPKDSDYLILYDSFKKIYNMNTEHEITLNPGILTITDIKYLKHNNSSKVIFFAEYKSYTKYELSKFLCK